MSRYPVEALLRPPVEFWSASTLFATAILVLMAPWVLALPPDVDHATAVLLGLFGCIRARQGWSVWTYQRNLRRLRPYALRAERIPCSAHRLFLGRGFRWLPKHTQRLRDTLRPELRRYVQAGRCSQWVRRLASRHSQPLATWLRRPCGWHPFAPPPAIGGNPVLHGVEPIEEDVWMDLGERVGHTLVLGTTRVGKTRLAELLLAQDIRRGDRVIVFDPKGDLDLLRRIYAEARRCGREGQFYLFHLGHPAVSARYNAIGTFSRITEVATRIANQLPSEGNSAAFKEFAWRFVNIIARALVALGRRPDYQQVRRYINDIEPLFIEYARSFLADKGPTDWEDAISAIGKSKDRNVPTAWRGRHPEAIALARYLQEQDLFDPVLEGLASAFKYDKTYFDKIVSSVGPLMEKLTTGSIAELISPNYANPTDQRPIFDWLEAIRANAIVYVGLDALSDQTVASAVGNSMFADLVSVAGYLYKFGIGTGSYGRPTVSVHADEFNELIGDEFVPLVSKAGGAGFQVTAYTQTWSDVEARIGNRAKAGQVAGNFNTLIMLRVKELATAELLTDQLPRVPVHALTSVSGVDDSSEPGSGIDFKSRNEDRLSVSEVPMLTPSDLVALPKGQAFALLEGGVLWKLRMPLPDGRGDVWMPAGFDEIAAAMTEAYRINEPVQRANQSWWRVGPSTLSGGEGG